MEFANVYEWLKTCPELKNLWAISAEITSDTQVAKVNNTANLYENVSVSYVDGQARITGKPVDDYYLTYTIMCYKDYIENQNDYNISAYDETQKVCDWLIEQENTRNLPTINGKDVLFIETLTPVPLEQWTDENGRLVAYYVTIRLHLKNPALRVDYVVT